MLPSAQQTLTKDLQEVLEKLHQDYKKMMAARVKTLTIQAISKELTDAGENIPKPLQRRVKVQVAGYFQASAPAFFKSLKKFCCPKNTKDSLESPLDSPLDTAELQKCDSLFNTVKNHVSKHSPQAFSEQDKERLGLLIWITSELLRGKDDLLQEHQPAKKKKVDEIVEVIQKIFPLFESSLMPVEQSWKTYVDENAKAFCKAIWSSQDQKAFEEDIRKLLPVPEDNSHKPWEKDPKPVQANAPNPIPTEALSSSSQPEPEEGDWDTTVPVKASVQTNAPSPISPEPLPSSPLLAAGLQAFASQKDAIAASKAVCAERLRDAQRSQAIQRLQEALDKEKTSTKTRQNASGSSSDSDDGEQRSSQRANASGSSSDSDDAEQLSSKQAKTPVFEKTPQNSVPSDTEQAASNPLASRQPEQTYGMTSAIKTRLSLQAKNHERKMDELKATYESTITELQKENEQLKLAATVRGLPVEETGRPSPSIETPEATAAEGTRAAIGVLSPLSPRARRNSINSSQAEEGPGMIRKYKRQVTELNKEKNQRERELEKIQSRELKKDAEILAQAHILQEKDKIIGKLQQEHAIALAEKDRKINDLLASKQSNQAGSRLKADERALDASEFDNLRAENATVIRKLEEKQHEITVLELQIKLNREQQLSRAQELTELRHQLSDARQIIQEHERQKTARIDRPQQAAVLFSGSGSVPPVPPQQPAVQQPALVPATLSGVDAAVARLHTRRLALRRT